MISKVTQLSVFMANELGELRKVTKTLSEVGVNLEAIMIAETNDFGILRIIASDYEKAKNALKENNFTIKETPVLKVGMENSPGALDAFLEKLNAKNIEVEYIYSSAGAEIFNIVKIKENLIEEAIKIF